MASQAFLFNYLSGVLVPSWILFSHLWFYPLMWRWVSYPFWKFRVFLPAFIRCSVWIILCVDFFLMFLWVKVSATTYSSVILIFLWITYFLTFGKLFYLKVHLHLESIWRVGSIHFLLIFTTFLIFFSKPLKRNNQFSLRQNNFHFPTYLSFLFWFFFFHFFLCHIQDMWNFLGQGSVKSLTTEVICRVNGRSLTFCATRELLVGPRWCWMATLSI